MLTQLDLLATALARIRGLLEHPVRNEDPECCLFGIGLIVHGMIGDTPGIPPDDEEDADVSPHPDDLAC